MLPSKSTLATLAALAACTVGTWAATLATPTLLTPANGTANLPPRGVSLTWSAVKSATGYDYRVLDSSGAVVKEGSVKAPKTSATLNLEYEKSYKWRVRSTKVGASPSGWSGAWSFKTASHPRPVLISPADGQVGAGALLPDGTVQVVLQWQAFNGSTRYQLQVANSPGFVGASVKNLAATSTTLILSQPGTVYWRVRSMANADKDYWSATGSFVPVGPRAAIEIVGPTPDQVTAGTSIPMSWLGVAGQKSYRWTLFEGRGLGSARRFSGASAGLADTHAWSRKSGCPSIGYLTLQVSSAAGASAPRTFIFKGSAPQIRAGTWRSSRVFRLTWSEVWGNQGYEVSIYNPDGSLRYTRQRPRDSEYIDILASDLPAGAFSCSVRATGYDGIKSDPSTTIVIQPFGR